MAPSAISSPTDEMESFNSNRSSSFGHRQINNLHFSSPFTNGHNNIRTLLSSSNSTDDTLDLLCIGFGPASLAIAIALHDQQSTFSSFADSRKVLFLEKQPQFAWHAGMQLPGAKMQISFLKDLATPRDPRSKFTFINYLFTQGRLNQFINLSTFLPSRAEYEDYLRWCASHFEREGKVAYGNEVCSVKVGAISPSSGKVTSWEVTSRDIHTGNLVTRKARHIVVAVGGRPVIPENMQGLKQVAHSSQFATTVPKIEAAAKTSTRPLRFAVVGNGQSAAEIFNDLWERFPESKVRLVIKGASLRPSDDSPFVNEIFDPDRVDGIYSQDPTQRASGLALDRGTNYGVVRLSLLEHLYDKLYMQRLRSSRDPSEWRANIITNRQVLSATSTKSAAVSLRLGEVQEITGQEEEMEFDYVFTATGYKRNAHEEMLSELKSLLPEKQEKFGVKRDYSVIFEQGKVDEGCGVWLQGCNEGTHGLSDTLLSILAIRGGELVQSMFGNESSAPSSGSISPV